MEQRSLAYENQLLLLVLRNCATQGPEKRDRIQRKKCFSKNLAISRSGKWLHFKKVKSKEHYNALLKEKGKWSPLQNCLGSFRSTSESSWNLKVDEYDYLKSEIEPAHSVSIGSIQRAAHPFEAQVTKIFLFMDSNTKSFTIEAKFTKAPPRPIPNLDARGQYYFGLKGNALSFPESYLHRDGICLNDHGTVFRQKLGYETIQSAGKSWKKSVPPPKSSTRPMKWSLILELARALMFARGKQDHCAAIGVTFSITMFYFPLGFCNGLQYSSRWIGNQNRNSSGPVLQFRSNPIRNSKPSSSRQNSVGINVIRSIKPSNSQVSKFIILKPDSKKPLMKTRESGAWVSKIASQVFYNVGSIDLTGVINELDQKRKLNYSLQRLLSL